MIKIKKINNEMMPVVFINQKINMLIYKIK